MAADVRGEGASAGPRRAITRQVVHGGALPAERAGRRRRRRGGGARRRRGRRALHPGRRQRGSVAKVRSPAHGRRAQVVHHGSEPAGVSVGGLEHVAGARLPLRAHGVGRQGGRGRGRAVAAAAAVRAVHGRRRGRRRPLPGPRELRGVELLGGRGRRRRGGGQNKACADGEWQRHRRRRRRHRPEHGLVHGRGHGGRGEGGEGEAQEGRVHGAEDAAERGGVGAV
mmetsp:Transcript_68291/g.191352  ORF Transcript_68291/g.191352 Transcript_68291/m.191352 type:complete len:226 (-) Transcript_68291:707-1384(-)